MYYIRMPFKALVYFISHIRVIALLIVLFIIYTLFMPITAVMRSCKFKKDAPVVTIDNFHYWLEKNGFTRAEMKKVKAVTNNTSMFRIAHKVTDVRDVEQVFKLQSIEKQKLVVVVLQQSLAEIDRLHELAYDGLRIRYVNLLFNWGALDAYKLGDVIAKKGQLCTRGENTRKKGDWEQRVASRVNLRVNAVLRCINTIVSEGKYCEDDPRMHDLVRTLNRFDDELDWSVFEILNEDYDHRLFNEMHTAATYVKQYMTNAIITESYCKRFGRIFWAWSVLLILVIFKLAIVALKALQFDFSELGDLVDIVVGAVTHLAESPMDVLDVLEKGIPTGGISLPSDGGPGNGSNDTSGTLMKIRSARLNARLENKTAQHQESMKLDKLTELAGDQTPTIEPLKVG